MRKKTINYDKIKIESAIMQYNQIKSQNGDWYYYIYTILINVIRPFSMCQNYRH